MRLPGLDAGSTYRLEPVLIGGIPRGAAPAHWWQDGPIVATGAVLSHAGVMMPALRPDQAVLLRSVREG